jgi:hypothetical protein
MNQQDPGAEEPGEFWRTLGKVLLSLVLGFAALIALGVTVCGFFLGAGMGSSGWSTCLVGAVVLGLLIYAIQWIWR